MRRRPEGWVPPGPLPPGDRGDPELKPGAGETLDCLSGHWKIFQLRSGHRYSTDDFLVAALASASLEADNLAPSRLLDLGCGIGSVGMLLLWRYPGLLMTGVEAQEPSLGLFARSLAYNGADHRATLLNCNLRDFDSDGVLFDLITGSPPYFIAGEGKRSTLPQRGPCRFEDRGGVEGYLETAARCLAPTGRVAWVHLTRSTEENLNVATSVGLGAVTVTPVVFRDGKPGLISIFVAGRGQGGFNYARDLVVRASDGEFTQHYRALRRKFGFPAQFSAGQT